mmetsp:Transcript_3708/g.8045  ORF Transcript_3708/g.8045 Transcript_3708/m.8045 type:complete len:126 (+) Transcript_3708:203-580(+)
MGCISSKAAADAAHQKEEEEAALGPPSEIMDASDHAQDLVMIVSKTIGLHLDVMSLDDLKATQMITRAVSKLNDGTMYYVKAQTGLDEWPWIFVKIYEPPEVTDVSPVTFKDIKKMKDDFKLVTF